MRTVTQRGTGPKKVEVEGNENGIKHGQELRSKGCGEKQKEQGETERSWRTGTKWPLDTRTHSPAGPGTEPVVPKTLFVCCVQTSKNPTGRAGLFTL